MDRNPDDMNEMNEMNQMNGTNNNEANEISKTYLADVMAAITSFEKRLSTQLGTSPTPSDRL